MFRVLVWKCRIWCCLLVSLMVFVVLVMCIGFVVESVILIFCGVLLRLVMFSVMVVLLFGVMKCGIDSLVISGVVMMVLVCVEL